MTGGGCAGAHAESQRMLERLSAAHLEELRRVGRSLRGMLAATRE